MRPGEAMIAYFKEVGEAAAKAEAKKTAAKKKKEAKE